jgi:hypothetical protein
MTADHSGIAVTADSLKTHRATPDSGYIIEYALCSTQIQTPPITLTLMRQIQTSIHVHSTDCDSWGSVVETWRQDGFPNRMDIVRQDTNSPSSISLKDE